MKKPIDIRLGTQIYQVTYDALKSTLHHTLQKKEYTLFLKLHQEAKTTGIVDRRLLVELRNKYPLVPEISNLLTYDYFKRKEIQKGEDLIRENYKNNPTDLFARINYADQCLRRKKLELIPQIFEGKFDLKLLYPEREVFHYSEISAFAILMSFYHLAISKKALALDFYKVAVQVDLHAPGLTALEKKLFKENLFKKVLSLLRRFLRSVKLLFHYRGNCKTRFGGQI